MTSKLSFYNMVKEEFKHHVVSMFVVIVYFLGKLLFYHFDLQQIMSSSGEMSYIVNRINDTAAPALRQVIPLMFIAAFLAAEYFSYLHSRKKSDFYMSLPISRSEKFVMGIVVSGGIFMIPFLLEKCLETMMVYSTGLFSAEYVSLMGLNIICTILCVAASWLTMTLAMIVTGHLVIALAAFGMMCSYVPFFLKELIPIYQQTFFTTYARCKMSDGWEYFSPISLAGGVVEKHTNYFIAIIIFIVVMTLISFMLYQRRPAEAAGKAMAFERANSIIKFMIVTPLSLYCGYFISCLAVGSVTIWMIVGSVIGVILLHGIMESIYQFDIRGIIAKKIHLVVICMICIGFISIFKFDIFKYEEYMPDENDVEKVTISFWGDYVNMHASSYADKECEGVSDEYVKVVLALVNNLIHQNTFSESVESTKEIMNAETCDIAVSETWNEARGSIELQYELKNGRWVSRQYSVDLSREENITLLDLLFSAESFKDDYYELYQINSEDIIEIYVGNSYVQDRVLLSKEEQAELIETYKRELTELSYSQMNEYDKVAKLDLKYSGNTSDVYYIYDEFEETIAYLEAHGYEIASPLANYELVRLKLEQEKIDEKDGSYYVTEHIIQDGAFLAEIKNELLLAELYDGRVHNVKGGVYAFAELNINGTLQSAGVWIRPETMKKIENNIE